MLKDWFNGEEMNIYYQESGPKDNQSIVFVHGGGLGSSCFKLQFEHFDDYHCFAPDLPGHSERHEEQLVSIQQCSQDVAEVIRNVVPEKIIYTGWQKPVFAFLLLLKEVQKAWQRRFEP